MFKRIRSRGELFTERMQSRKEALTEKTCSRREAVRNGRERKMIGKVKEEKCFERELEAKLQSEKLAAQVEL